MGTIKEMKLVGNLEGALVLINALGDKVEVKFDYARKIKGRVRSRSSLPIGADASACRNMAKMIQRHLDGKDPAKHDTYSYSYEVLRRLVGGK